MRKLMTICAAILFAPAIGLAVPTVYTDEAGYLTALAGYDTVFEGFEGSDWDALHYPSSVSTLTTQGVTWTASDMLTVIGGTSAWDRSGNWGVFDSEGDPDIISISTVASFFGVGGWFASTTASTIDLEVDGQPVGTLNLGQNSAHRFLGVTDPDSFSLAVFNSPSGHWGADDFTIAFGIPDEVPPDGGTEPDGDDGNGVPGPVIPTPGAVLLAGIGVGLVGWLRRYRTL